MMQTETISSTGYTGPVGRELVTAPTGSSVVPLASLRLRLRVPFTDEDADLQAFLESATAEIEDALGRRLLPQTWRWWYDDVPPGRVIVLPEPARAIVAVKSFATDGDTVGTTLTSTEYELDARRDRLVIDDGTALWPPSSVRDYNAVSIEATVGYASAAAIPAGILQAVYLTVQGHYLRGAEPPAEAAMRRHTIVGLLAPYRYRMGVA